MDTVVLIVYIAVFLLLCCFLVWTMKRNRIKNWVLLFAAEALSAAAAFCAMHIFDALPGKGMAPGLTWFAEVFYSLGAAVLYAILLPLSFLLFLFKWRK